MAGENVPILIDKQKYESPAKTTGAALYVLGKVPSGYDLWLEVPGPKPDELVTNSSTELDVHSGAHFYMAKQNLNPGRA